MAEALTVSVVGLAALSWWTLRTRYHTIHLISGRLIPTNGTSASFHILALLSIAIFYSVFEIPAILEGIATGIVLGSFAFRSRHATIWFHGRLRAVSFSLSLFLGTVALSFIDNNWLPLIAGSIIFHYQRVIVEGEVQSHIENLEKLTNRIHSLEAESNLDKLRSIASVRKLPHQKVSNL